MTSDEAVNRGNNLGAAAILGIAGLAFLPEIIIESEWLFKLDDMILFLIGGAAVWWYRRNSNRLTRTMNFIWATGAALLTKIMAIILEIHDPEDVGDDFGALILFTSALLLAIYLYRHREQSLGLIRGGRTADFN